MFSNTARSLLVTIYLILALARAGAVDWPEGYIVHEGSESPNGQYGIAVPESDEVEQQQSDPKVEDYSAVNYLADVKKHKLLGKIRSSDYFDHQNHAGLTVHWSDDSKTALVDYESRFGFASIALLQLQGNSFSQTDLGEHIQKAIDGVIKKESRGSETTADTIAEFRFDSSWKRIRVYARATTNPKQFEHATTYRALFLGTFDVPSRKWISSNARQLNEKQDELLENAFQTEDVDNFVVNPEAFAGLDPDAIEPQFYHDKVCFRSEENIFKHLDESMNQVYQAARFLLPPAQFAKLKNDQIDWLKKRDGSGSMSEKSKLTAKRIEKLQEQAW